MQKIFSNAKVQRQLFTTFLFAFSMPILAIGIFLIVNTQKTLKNHYMEQTQAENLRVKSIFFDITTNIYNISENFVVDERLQTILRRRYSNNLERIYYLDDYPLIYNTFAKDTSTSSIVIYHNNKSIGDYGNFSFITEKLKKSDWYKKASSTFSIFWNTKYRLDFMGNEYFELTMYRKIPLISTNDFAILEITASDNYLRNRIENNTLQNIACINQDSIFYSSDRSLKGSTIPVTIDYRIPYYQQQGTISLMEEDYIGAITTLHPYQSDDNLYIVSFSTEALPYVHNIIFSYALIVLLALLLPCILLYLFTCYFSARVITLRSVMHQASKGDYNIIESFHGNDELSETFRDLQIMIDEIKQKEAKIYETQIKEQQLENKQQQMEFKMLASQINPHFLYNTLETIRMKAFTAGNREVATAIKLLGKSMRYVLENTGTASTTLDKELNYIKTYLAIQRLRFEDRVNYTLIIQEGLNLSEFSILPLLLQPIIENAISHGLEGVEYHGEIQVHIYTEETEYLCIDISDNGIGMDRDSLEQLRETIQTTNTTRTHSIGLYNINQRISLCYGSKYTMQIQSKPGVGTCISLKLPFNDTRNK